MALIFPEMSISGTSWNQLEAIFLQMPTDISAGCNNSTSLFTYWEASTIALTK
jgi:hypothetical protein